MHLFGMWEETAVPGETSDDHRENIDSIQTVSVDRIKPRSLALYHCANVLGTVSITVELLNVFSRMKEDKSLGYIRRHLEATQETAGTQA